MPSWVNYHSHTNYCDGSSSPIDYIKEAVRLELPAYGFSSHAPVNFKTDWCMGEGNLVKYLAEINEIKRVYRELIEVYVGLEIDYIPHDLIRKQRLIDELKLDYFIGSVHFVGSFENGDPWNIDTSYELFTRGLIEIYKSNFKKAGIKFFELTRQMIEEYKPTVVGHIDKIKMFNSEGSFFKETDKWYREQVILTINKVKEYNSILEINTRGYYKYHKKDLYPSEWIIELMNKQEIPITINSDAHHPSEITNGMAYAAEMLKSLSVDKIYALYNNKWREFEFNEEGIFFS
jgi:histidinol-phosphatase (PHP family)